MFLHYLQIYYQPKQSNHLKAVEDVNTELFNSDY